MTTGNTYLDSLLSAQRFADLLCNAIGAGVAITLQHVEDPDKSFVALGGIAGPDFPDPELAIYAASTKAAELRAMGPVSGRSMTPIPGFNRGLGWMGGVKDGNKVVGVSNWPQEHDRLLALIVAFSLKHHHVYLHHAGTRFPSIMSMNESSTRFGSSGIHVPAEDHSRIYHKVSDPMSPLGHYYKEFQHYPGESTAKARHWDLYVPDGAEELLRYVASAFEVEPEFWDADLNDPVGAVWIPDKNGAQLGVMARDIWWEIGK